MARRYAAFIVRCWLTGAGEQRIEIEHVQSGEKTRCASALSAVAWLYAQTAGESPGLSHERARADDPDGAMTDDRRPP